MYKGKHNPRKSSDGSRGESRTGRGFGGENKSERPASKSGFSKGDSDDTFRGEKKSFGDSDKGGFKKSYSKDAGGEKKSYGDRDSKPYGEKKSYGDRDSKPYGEKKPYGDRDSKPYGEKKSYGDRDSKPYGEKKSYGDRDSKPYGEKKSYGDRDSKPYGEKKSYGDRDSKPYSSDRGGFKKDFGGEKKSYGDRDSKPSGERKSYGDRDSKPSGERKSYGDRDSKPRSSERGGFKKDFGGEKKPYGDREKRSYGSDKPGFKKSYGDDAPKEPKAKPTRTAYYDDGEEKMEFGEDPSKKKFTGKSPFKKKKIHKEGPPDDGSIRLNRYLASAGVGSRREADKLIESGAVKVNGKVVTEMGTKVFHNDKVEFGGERVKSEVLRYILLNKPKDYITTNEDPQNRKTVIDLVRGACAERVFPVGRLDRNTTGLLLITNDGDLAKKLTHPSHQIKKIYHVELDKNLTIKDMEAIREGIKLDDGIIKVDEITYVEGAKSKKEVGVAIHSGKNRIVRRIFESLEHNVVKLDRVYFGGLTKKNLPKGRWRFLTDLELSMLKML